MAKVIRVKKNKNYTTMGNFHLREKGLSYKAMGILSFMLSLPDDWDYTIEGLAKCANDGIDSVRSALNELEKFGFLERPGRERDKKGHYRGSEYVIYEMPISVSQTENPNKNDMPTEGYEPTFTPQPILENPTLDAHSEVAESLENTDKDGTSPILENPTLEKPIQGSQIMVKPYVEKPVSENPILENPILEKSVQENPIQLNTNILNTNILNINIPNQRAREAAQNISENPKEYNGLGRGMYFPESKELSDSFYDWMYMRKCKGGGSMTVRTVKLTKDWLREISSKDGVMDIGTAIDILNFSTMNQYSKLYS